MSNRSVECDERTVAVTQNSYRWGFLLLTFGLLADIAYRGLAAKQQSWDLLALVVGAALVTTGYQAAHGILGRRWLLVMAIALVIGAVVSFVLTTLLH